MTAGTIECERAGLPVPHYDGALTVQQARAQYFAANGLGDGGYEARWVKLQAGPFPIFIPNTQGRVRAVRLHDVHHVVTEYDTTWSGEAEIAAWEIASGCAHHYAAWWLNLNALAIGLAIAPRAVFRAFLRGWRSLNIYCAQLDDVLLSQTVGALRRHLQLDAAPDDASFRACLAFAAWGLASILSLLATTALSLALIALPVLLLFR